MLTSDLDELLTRTAEIHRALDRTRVLITGGTGFFGRWLTESWVDASDRLGLDRVAVVVTRDPERFRELAPHVAEHRSIELVRGDVLDAVAPVGSAFDACVHAATPSGTTLTPGNSRAMFDTVVTGTANVFGWLAGSGSVPLLFTSSGAVYGTQPPRLERISETYPGAPDPLDPGAAYAEAKRAAEMLCTLAPAGGPRARIARCFAFAGPHLPLDAHFAIGNFVGDALASRPIVVQGDGTPVRSYMYPTDLITWLWTILLNGESRRAYNVGSPDGHHLGDVAAMVADVADVPVVVRGIPVPGRRAPRYVPDVSRAARELGLTIEVGLEESILRHLTWARTARPARTLAPA